MFGLNYRPIENSKEPRHPHPTETARTAPVTVVWACGFAGLPTTIQYIPFRVRTFVLQHGHCLPARRPENRHVAAKVLKHLNRRMAVVETLSALTSTPHLRKTRKCVFVGARNGVRTRDNRLGKPRLCLLSYPRFRLLNLHSVFKERCRLGRCLPCACLSAADLFPHDER